MEGIVLLMVVLAPWFFGAVDPIFEYALFAGIALICVLWGVRSVVEQHFLWFSCPVALCLGLMFFIGIFQLVPMPSALLHVASPAAASLNSDLRPIQLEIITEGEPPTARSPWPTISVNPYSTQQWLVRLLAIIVLFAAVRVNFASTESLKRLAWVAFANGVALSIFALYQFVHARSKGGDEHNRIFGFFTRGEVFGTFICRNHFAYYVNICIGLGVALLLISGRSENDKRASRTHKAQALVEQTAESESTVSLLSILHSPLQLWLSVGIALMVGAVICSLSRGGVAALVGGLITAYLLRSVSKLRRTPRWEVLVVPVLLFVGLISWLGIKPLESRLAVSGGDLSADGRLVMWKNLLSLVWRFPIFGSGNGTLQYVEPLTRSRDFGGYNASVDIDHAHNDYLEALIEGGVLRFGLTVAIVVLLVRYGRKAMRRHEIRTPGRLAFGAFVGIVAVALQSFVDFGLSTPAVTVLATVAAAFLCTMARSDPSEPPTTKSKHALVVKLNGWGGIVSAAALMLVGLVLLRNGSVATKVESNRIAAANVALPRKDRPPNSELAVKFLTDAVAIAPTDARLRSELAQLYLDWYKLRAKDSSEPITKEESFARYIKPALQQFIAARDLCPLLARPQARLALYAQDAHPEIGITMAKSDSALAYCARAVRLTPFDADILNTYGQLLFQASQFDAASDAWRRSLSHRPTHLRAIVTTALPKLGPDGIVKLLPDDPAVLIEAARILSDRPELSASLPNLLKRAKKSLLDQVGANDPDSTHLLAQCHRMLGESAFAQSAYRDAITLSGSKIEWQYEFAEYLYSLSTPESLTEAKKVIDDVLSKHGGHGPAIKLRADIERELTRP